ncbi:MAG: chorismate synthase [Clostridia bacterium]|nr:chorismate synthase [Clostridia bacterium]
MSSEFGKILKISVFGESHGEAIGAVIDGLPAGEAIDMNELIRFMSRRSPGQNEFSTKRREKDVPKFLSGVADGQTCGSPVCAVIENTDAHSGDYSEFSDRPRPAHADYPAFIKFRGNADMRGGGHFSGRLTAPLCIAGGIAVQILARRGIHVGAHLSAAAGVCDLPFPTTPGKTLFEIVSGRIPPVVDEGRGREMAEAIKKAAEEGDSVGGIVECAVTGLPAGLGSPMFGGMENRLAAAIFGIPAVRGVEFGAGFAAAEMRGSAHNDPFVVEDGRVGTAANNHGGILGGISTGMPVVLRAAFKPTPSIGKAQWTVDLSTMEPAALSIRGRHDPCVAVRAVPVVEAVTAAVILDILLEEKGNGTF